MVNQIKFRTAFFTFDEKFSHFDYWGTINHKNDFDNACFKSPSQNNNTYRKCEDQFTGIIDKHGSEIFAGDIVKEFNGISAIGFGEYVNCRERDNGKSIGFYFYDPHGTESESFGPPASGVSYEIIGNIYENFDIFKP